MDYLNTTMTIFGYITGTGAAVVVLYKLYMWFKKPSNENHDKIEKNSVDIEKLKERADKNYSSIEEIKDMQKLLIRSMMELVDNSITGNNIEGLKKVKKDLVTYLTD